MLQSLIGKQIRSQNLNSHGLQDFDPVAAYQRFKSVFKRGEDSDEEDEEIIDDFNFSAIFSDSQPDKQLKRLTSAWKRASKDRDSQIERHASPLRALWSN